MAQNKILLLVLMGMVAGAVFYPQSEARRIQGMGYPLEEYHIVGTEIGEARINQGYLFSFPVSVSEQHVSAYLWIKKLIEEGRLSKGLPLVYLDAHLDHFVGKTHTVQSSNWVRAVLDEKLCDSAVLILPEWIYEDVNMVYRVKLYDAVGEIQRLYQHQLNISELEDLSLAENQSGIVLSIDCDYFSNMGYPNHRVSPREIEEEIAKIVNVLESRNIRIAALNIAVSPGYTWLDQETFIRDKLLETFLKYGEK